MLDLLLDDENDGFTGRFLDLVKVLVLPNGWTDLTARQKVHGGRVPD